MHLSELIPFLKELGTAPKRGLSQNFLIDMNIVKKIIALAEIDSNDSVLEIGPGPGALTAALLDAQARVFAIEKDTVFAHALSRLQTSDLRLNVANADALDFPLNTIAAKKVVANLPYHITTPLLERLFSCSFSSCTLMVQKEFAIRLLAQSGSKDFSSLTLFTQFHANIKGMFHVSSRCFYPKPSVDSTVIRLDFRPPPLIQPEPFFKLVRRAFQERRKMLSTSLQEFYSASKVKDSLSRAGMRSDSRPEMLSLEQWLVFFREIND